MKRSFISILTLAAFVALSLVSRAESADAENALLSFWDFNGRLTESRGNNKDDLAVGDGANPTRFVSSSEVPGVEGKAVALGVERGDVERLMASTSPDVRIGPDYTIEAWIHPTQIATWNRLVLNWGKQHAYHFAIHNGALSLYHGEADGALVFAEGGAVQSGRWHHVAGVARRNEKEPEKSALEVYLNGKRTAIARFDGTIATLPREGLGIGDSAEGTGKGNRFRGYLDEVSIWNRSLDPEEIASHYEKRAETLTALERARRQKEIKRRAEKFAQWKEHGIEEIVFSERNPGRDPSGHYYANFGYSCTDPDLWLHGADGGGLIKLNILTGERTLLVDASTGAVRDPQVHYDAKKILFSYRKGGTHQYNLYEIGVDGKNLRQITHGPWDDIESAYLPDGGIVFSSSRCKRYIGCWLAQSATLFRCDANGENIRMLSSGNFTENTPSVLPDGRVLYTRWEYVNRDPVVFHHLWTMNPDGSAQAAYYGNMRPGGVFIDAKPIPKTDRVVFIHSHGHGRNEHAGAIATVTDKAGPDEPSSFKTLAEGAAFRDPSAISKDLFLAAKGNQILQIDSKGEATLLHTGAMMAHEPSAIVRRPRENRISEKLDLSKTTGTVLLANVYTGRNMDGVERGSIKKLLILEDLPKPANFHGGGSQPIGHGVTSTLKRILGTVPVHPDGSAYFEVPAMRSVYWAILDAEDCSVKQMRSFATLQPGETLSCVGCHEPRANSPLSAAPASLQALNKPMSKITPFDDIPEIIDFPRDVQPILDKHCVPCHNHKERRGHVVLEGDRGPVFSHSYYTLFLQWQIKDTAGKPGNGSGQQKGNDAPHTTYSSASPLMDKINGGHNKAELSAHEKTVIRLWIDVSAQYPGTYAAYGTGQIGGYWANNEPIRVMADAWPSTPPAQDAVERRCLPCHGKMFPKHVTYEIPLSHGDLLSWQRPMTRFSRHRIYNLTRPDKSLALLAPLSAKAGGYAEGEPKEKLIIEDRSAPLKRIVHPVIFKSANDPDYGKILAHIIAAKAKLDQIKRFDMPRFKPNEHYIREMKRYGVLAKNFNLARDDIDVYKTDLKYWESMWHVPEGSDKEPNNK